jgi:hypothetical protein
MATKTIKGMDELVRKLDTIAKLKGAKRGLKAGAVHVRGKISRYPPSTMANSPTNPTGRWYERSYGPRWLRKRSGSIGGRKTSERLDAKWAQRSRDKGLTQVIGNNASYAPWVHASEEVGGKGPQASFHGDRGWKTDEQVLKSEGDEVLQFIQREVEKELAR